MKTSLSISLTLLFSAAAHAGKIKYTYDATDRVTAADYGGGKVTTLRYDANGNLFNRTTLTAATANLRFSGASVSPSTTAAGTVFTFTFTVTNDGPDTATGVMLHTTVPLGVMPLTVSAPQGLGAISGRTVNFNLGVLASGASVIVTNTARHGYAGVFNIPATITATQTDPTPANNSMIVAATATAPADNDGDGIPNWWETLNISGSAAFNGTGVNGADGDFDGDGVSNLDEFIADTRANDFNANFRVTDFGLEAGVFSITFPTSPFRLYSVELATDLLGFTPLVEDIQGSGGEITIEDPVPPPGRAFYRVGSTIPTP